MFADRTFSNTSRAILTAGNSLLAKHAEGSIDRIRIQQTLEQTPRLTRVLNHDPPSSPAQSPVGCGLPERVGARALLKPVPPRFGSSQKIWRDGGDTGPEFAGWVSQLAPRGKVEVVKRSDGVRGFRVPPKRWVVERTLGWVMRHRGLVRDYERTTSSAIGRILVALFRVMLGRFA